MFNLNASHSQTLASIQQPQQRTEQRTPATRPLKQVLNELSRKHGVSFSYDRKTVENKVVEAGPATNAPVDDQIQQLLRSVNLRYEKVDRNVYVILPDEPAKSRTIREVQPKTSATTDLDPSANRTTLPTLNPMQSMTASVPEMRVTVTGQVRAGDTGEGLPGVNVTLKGTQTGAVTDGSGRYSISVPDENAVLVFSFIGYLPQEVPVGNRTTVNITLAADVKSLNEVVVVGYGTQNRRDITGSIASVDQKAIKNIPVAGLDQKLQGQVAGVQVVQTSGGPGGGVAVRIRGMGTVGNNQPLYVVDGFPITAPSGNDLNTLNSIDPNDIESMEILKDASATAIYGSRGANGVVLITTKRGKSGKTQVEFNASTGWQEVARTIPQLTAREQAEVYSEARINGWNARADLRPASQSLDAYLATPNANRGAFRIPDGMIDPNSYTATTDWQGAVFRKAPIQTYQLNVSGGTDKLRFAVSGGLFNQQGIIINSDFKRYSFRANLDADLSPRVKMGVSLAPSYSTANIVQATGHFNNQSIINTALLMFPGVPVYNPDGSYGQQIADSRLNVTAMFNPVALASEATRIRSIGRVLSNAYLDIEVLRNLRLRSTLGADVSNTRNRNFFSSQYGTTALPPTVPSANTNSAEILNWLNENTLSYNWNRGAHNLNALAGYTVQQATTEFMSVGRAALPNDLIPYPIGPADQGSANSEQWRLLSYLARINYSFNDRYLLTATYRTDGSSRFGSAKKFGSFPSFAVGWRMSEESFLKPVRAISDWKWRLSYGVTGNNEIGNYSAQTLLNPGQYVGGAGLGSVIDAIIPANIGNNQLTWETATKWDAGVDIGLLNNRIMLTVDYYYNKTRDLLLSVAIPSSSGFTGALQNIGSIENKGWEFTVNTQNLTGNVRWSTNLNLSTNQNKVLDLGAAGTRLFGDASPVAQLSVTQVGQPMAQFFGLLNGGVFRNQQEVDSYTKDGKKVQPLAQPGDRRFVDVNNDGVINNDDRTFIGNPFPRFIFGMTNNFSYKGFDLSVLLNGSVGNKVANLPLRWMSNMNGNLRQHAITRDRWRSPEQPGNGDVPRAILNPRNNPPDAFSTFYVEDGSFLRVRNVALSYTLPGEWTRKISLASARLFVNGANLYTFTKYRGFDPETNERGDSALEQGIDAGGYPIARTYTAGVAVTF
ncbi:TonB-dependent receptor [Nibrella saemangeumensis]|uniref:TonB-dependent receptor n=1 Tax=Nibrella saemangeumensis TaxID=1084526 RepID=A0ABP8MLE8_9BACT